MNTPWAHRFARVALVAVAAVAGLSWVAPNAEAATPTCTKVVLTAGQTSGANDLLRVPVSSGSSFNCLLGQGNANSAVTALQNALNYCYGAGISADGIFGSRTKTALQSAQRREGVSADGVYGPTTSSHLKFMSVSEITDARRCGGRR